MLKKILNYYRSLGKLMDEKKGLLSFIVSIVLVFVLFLLPYLIILFNVFQTFSILSDITIILLVFFPLYFQICVGLFFKYFYQLCLDRGLEKIEDLTPSKAFMVGLVFIPTFILIVILVIILFIV